LITIETIHIVDTRAHIIDKSSAKSFGNSASLLHVGECTLPLFVLAVACAMRNEALRSVTGRYGTLRSRPFAATQH